jgi:hypothetical protein
MPRHVQRVGQRHPEPSGEVVVAGAPGAQRRIHPARHRPPRRRYYRLASARVGALLEAALAVAADAQQPRPGKPRQIAACRLRLTRAA